MARPRTITDRVDTGFFMAVTPTWCKPWLRGGVLLDEIRHHLPLDLETLLETPEGRTKLRSDILSAFKKVGRPSSRIDELWIESISPEFEQAARLLALWAGFPGAERDNWARHPENTFFRVRDRLIDICNTWRGYDWRNYREVHAKKLKLYRAKKAVAESLILLSHERDLTPDEAQVLHTASTPVAGPFWLGAFEWNRFPNELPLGDHVLFGAILSVSFNRCVIDQPRARHDPLDAILDDAPPCGLPWSALAEFTRVTFGEAAEIDPNNFQKSVKLATANLSRFYRRPMPLF